MVDIHNNFSIWERFPPDLLEWFRVNKINYPWRKEKRIFLRGLCELLLRRTTAQAISRRWDKITKLANPVRVVEMPKEELKQIIRVFGLVNSRVNEIKSLAQAHLTKSLSKRAYNELIELPGIGLYTANAIMCFVGHQRKVISDSNFSRVIGRLYYINFKPDDKELLELLDKLLPHNFNESIRFNQAMLDFAKLICQPVYPKCLICFANSYCRYYKETH